MKKCLIAEVPPADESICRECPMYKECKWQYTPWIDMFSEVMLPEMLKPSCFLSEIQVAEGRLNEAIFDVENCAQCDYVLECHNPKNMWRNNEK